LFRIPYLSIMFLSENEFLYLITLAKIPCQKNEGIPWHRLSVIGQWTRCYPAWKLNGIQNWKSFFLFVSWPRLESCTRDLEILRRINHVRYRQRIQEVFFYSKAQINRYIQNNKVVGSHKPRVYHFDLENTRGRRLLDCDNAKTVLKVVYDAFVGKWFILTVYV
jgi:hypothetical protein